jgi:hypothetical protein
MSRATILLTASAALVAWTFAAGAAAAGRP